MSLREMLMAVEARESLSRSRRRRSSRGGASGGGPAQGRGAGEGSKPAGTPTDHDPAADARGPVEGLRCRRQA